MGTPETPPNIAKALTVTAISALPPLNRSLQTLKLPEANADNRKGVIHFARPRSTPHGLWKM